MGWNKYAAVDYLIKHAGPTSKSPCAVYTRLTIAAGGITILNTEYTKDYGNSLLKARYTALPSSSNPEKGDVVIQPYHGSCRQADHMAMFDGKRGIPILNKRIDIPVMVTGGITHLSTENSAHKQKMTQWVSKKLLARLDAIYNMPEQEFLEADYFTCTQDYATEWIHRLRTTPGVADGSSQRVDVWLGIQDNKYKHLQVWTRKEEGEWKIWRVVDAGNHIEQKLY